MEYHLLENGEISRSEDIIFIKSDLVNKDEISNAREDGASN